MARPIQYDRDAVTAKAMTVFWQEGFNGSSVDKLVQATGLNKHSLYKAFDGKDGLFRSCLERYIEREAAPFFDILADNNGLQSIRSYFELVHEQDDGNSGRGCMVANTAVELGASHEVVHTLIDDYYDRLATLLSQAIEQGQADKQIKSDINTLDTAKWLVHIVQGLAMSYRFHSSVMGDIEALLALIATHPTNPH